MNKKLNERYWSHRTNAKVRGIPFLLTFDQWKTLWLESGKWLVRGYRRGQYVMARFGDQGAYEIGNVKICPVEENLAERKLKGLPKTTRMRLALSATAKGRKRVYREGHLSWAYPGDLDFPLAR